MATVSDIIDTAKETKDLESSQFQGSYTVDIGTDTKLPKDLADLYNPGYSEIGSGDRADMVETGGIHDISNRSKETLGKYLSAQTRGVIDPTHASKFQQSPYNVGASVKGPLGISVDLNLSKAVEASLASSQLQVEGRTFGTYLDVAMGVNSDAAYAFGASRLPSVLSIDTGDIGDALGQIASAVGLGDEDNNVALLKVRPRGDASSATLGNPRIVDDDASGLLQDLIGGVSSLLPVPGLQKSRIQKNVSSVLKTNRFSPIERAYVQNNEKTGTGIVVQNNMGVHSPSSAGLLNDIAGAVASFLGIGPYEVSEDELTSIAANTLNSATGQAAPLKVDLPLLGKVSLFGDSDPDPDPRATGVPHVDVQSLRAGKRTKYSSSEYVNPDERILSYGTINTPAAPFEGPVSPEPMFKIVATGFNEVLDATNNIRALVSGIEGIGSSPAARATTLAGVGRHRDVILQSSQTSIQRDLGIPDTVRKGGEDRHDWYECFLRGTQEYLGFEYARTTKLDLQNLPDDFKAKVSAAPGYYVAIARNSMRGAKEVSVEVQRAQSKLFSTENNQATREAALKSLISLISSSSTWKFTLAMIALGYRSLEDVYATLNPGDTVGSPSPNPIGGVQDSRDSSGKISLRHSLFIEQGNTAYVLPSSLSRAASKFGGAHETMDLKPSVAVPGTGALTGSKVDAETVQRIENALDSEHVPFYFHDLRTNEIIAFHAFLTELTDSFAPSYTNTAAYGRGDEVMVYNNTKRSINFGFTLVAMSTEDMDVLYWNVNKLVSMVYPQYSKGRTMVSGDQRFVQPFSQIPTASPMIRVRVGDMVKSNYSKFGLARLFGLGHEDSFKATTARQREIRRVGRSQNLQKAEMIVANQRKRMRLADPSARGKEVVGSLAILDLKDASGELATTAPRGSLTREHSLLAKHAARVPFKGIIQSASFEPYNEDDSKYTLFLINISEITIEGGTFPASVLGNYTNYNFRVDQPREQGQDLVEAELEFSPTQKQAIYSEALRNLNAETETEVTDATDENTAISEFFSSGPNGNPIVRSFESARGRGMAGFITSLNFDWADSVWDIAPGKRAPQMMKVSVQFSPIHDIPLGLDSDGAMRSVAYGVGSYSTGLGGDPYDKSPSR